MKIYIGNIAHSTNEEELTSLFADVEQPVSLEIITDRMSGKSRGFGFAEFSNRTSGQSIINKFDGYSLSGRPLKVNEAREKTQNSRGRGSW